MKNCRGFELQYFLDDYGVKCSIQESSAVEPHLWLGVSRPEVTIMYKDAIEAGLNLPKKFPETNEYGVCNIPIPDKAFIDSRMHLNRKQAKEIAKKLNYFARHGYLKPEKDGDGK